MRAGLWVAAALSAWGTQACRDDPPRIAESPATAAGPLNVELAGCSALHATPTGALCELSPERTVRAFLPADLPPDARLSGAAGTLAPGALAVLTVDVGAAAIEVVAGDRAWRQAVSPFAPDSVVDPLAALRKAGRLDEALTGVDAALPSAPDALRGRLLGLRGRILVSRGDTVGATAAFEQALRLHRASGRLTDEVKDALALAFVQIHQTRDLVGARRTLATAGAAARLDPEGAATVSSHLARLALETGDVRGALSALDEAVPRLARFGDSLRLSLARQALAETYQALGRLDEAVALLRQLQSPAPADPCGVAALKNDLAWAMMQAAGEGPAPAEADRLLFEAASGFLGPCPRPADAASTHLNRALLALRTGDASAARTQVASARAALPKPDARLALWLPDVEGRVALASGAPAEAARNFERLRALGAATFSVEARWRGTVGLARAEWANGRPKPALAAFAEAETLLSDQALEIPLAAGRETFFAEREASSKDFVEALMEAGRADEAMGVARRARARFLAALRRADRLPTLSPEARERWDSALADYHRARAELDAEAIGDWELPTERLEAARASRTARETRLRDGLDRAFSILAEPGDAGSALPPPATHELIVAWFPGRAGLWAFAADAQGTSARRVDATSRGDALFAPFSEQLGRAKRLRVLPYGPMRGVDLHALPFRGRPLIAHLPVVYGLDLPAVSPEARPPFALLIADPRGDLRGARAEVDAVQVALAGAGPNLARLDGQQATGPAVREALGRATILHYAGHGRFAGHGGWESALPLAADGRLTVHDILALQRVPRLVVLSGCETARQAESTPLEALGLAQAFLAAGAQAALASVRPVDDALAREVAVAFHEAHPEVDAAEALRAAQLKILSADAARPAGVSVSRDWAAFRVLVR